MFTNDLLAPRPGAPAKHTIVALGSSSVQKGAAFVDKVWEGTPGQPRPQVYSNYQGVYDNPEVDIVYIGTPHSLHKRNCLDAIKAGKNVLCEKPFTINEKEAQEVIAAAREKGVFVMEGMIISSDARGLNIVSHDDTDMRLAVWTRFFPLFKALHEEIIEKKSIGEVQRFFMDFGNNMALDTLPSDSRLKDPALGAGALLDIGVYTLTYASIIMGEWKVGKQHPQLKKVTSSMTIVDGIDETNVVVLDYPLSRGTGFEGGKTAICTSTFRYRSADDFARIEGSHGTIVIFGPAASVPSGFRIVEGPQPRFGEADSRSVRIFNVEKPEGTMGFFWEADAVADDIASCRAENAILPLDETLRIMRLMDSIRREGGLVYPQD